MAIVGRVIQELIPAKAAAGTGIPPHHLIAAAARGLVNAALAESAAADSPREWVDICREGAALADAISAADQPDPLDLLTAGFDAEVSLTLDLHDAITVSLGDDPRVLEAPPWRVARALVLTSAVATALVARTERDLQTVHDSFERVLFGSSPPPAPTAYAALGWTAESASRLYADLAACVVFAADGAIGSRRLGLGAHRARLWTSVASSVLALTRLTMADTGLSDRYIELLLGESSGFFYNAARRTKKPRRTTAKTAISDAIAIAVGWLEPQRYPVSGLSVAHALADAVADHAATLAGWNRHRLEALDLLWRAVASDVSSRASDGVRRATAAARLRESGGVLIDLSAFRAAAA